MDDPGYMHVHINNIITFKHKIYVTITLFHVTFVISKQIKF